LVADPGADDPSEVAALPERSASVLSRRYGLDGRPRSLTAVGEILGVSRERLRERRRELGLERLAA
jgi:DNA-directed RNA polymerase sigma subunit (sigma70/sigma32)